MANPVEWLGKTPLLYISGLKDNSYLMMKNLIYCTQCRKPYSFVEADQDERIDHGQCYNCNLNQLRNEHLTKMNNAVLVRISDMTQTQYRVYEVQGDGIAVSDFLAMGLIPPFLNGDHKTATVDPSFGLYYIDQNGKKQPFDISGKNDGMPEVS